MASADLKKKLFQFIKLHHPVYAINNSLDTQTANDNFNTFPGDCEMLVSDLISFLNSSYHEHVIDGLSLIARISSQANVKLPVDDAHQLLENLVPLLASPSNIISNLAATSLALLVESSSLNLNFFLDDVRRARDSTKSSCAVRHIDRMLDHSQSVRV